MKSILFALVAALLMLGQVFTPALASSDPSAAAAVACGDTYTVKRGDYLSKIARECGVTLSSLIAANPEIKDINKIYPGQVIRIKAGASIPPTGPVGTDYTVQRGDTLFKIAVRFGTTVDALLKLNPSIKNASLIYAGQVIKIPSGTVDNTRRVTVSATTAKASAQVEVKVFGFPANAEIDFRLGKQNAGASVIYDGKTDANGQATFKVTIPESAAKDEKWVVRVLTTSMVKAVEATSPVITIVQ